jgi:hypothetical protein
MKYVIDQEAYVDADKLALIAEQLAPIVANKAQLDPFLFDIAREDGAYGDLTDTHPSERKNVASYAALVYGGDVDPQLKEILGETYDLMTSLQGLTLATLFFIAPHSVVPRHIHDMERPEYDYTPEYNVFLGISVPSEEAEFVGAQVGKDVYNNANGRALIFDYQVPHSAWNNTDDWWLGIIFYINKECFNESSNA